MGKKKRTTVKSRNPVARAVRRLRPKMVPSKKVYSRKAKVSEDE